MIPTASSGEVRDTRRNRVPKMFPLLGERAAQRAGTMSGGQQRMLSLGPALTSDPKGSRRV